MKQYLKLYQHKQWMNNDTKTDIIILLIAQQGYTKQGIIIARTVVRDKHVVMVLTKIYL